jgi:hypothetical protein
MATFVMSMSPSFLQAIPQVAWHDERRQVAEMQLKYFSIEDAELDNRVVVKGYNPDRSTLSVGQE